MADLTSTKTARAVARTIYDVGTAAMMGEEVELRAKEAGFDDSFAFYFVGRAGVLGDGVNADVVTAALGWFEPQLVRAKWDAGVAIKSPREAAPAYADALATWGEKHLAGIANIERLVALAERVVDGAEGSGLPIFSGWRAEPRPESAPARLIHLIFLLREWRGGLHLNATTAVGLAPLEAILTNEGPDQAGGFGWTGEFPDVTALAPRHEEAEEITDRLTGAVYARLLSEAELAEFTELIQSTGKAVLT